MLSAAGIEQRLVFHLVGPRWTVAAGETWAADETRASEIVFIGKDLAEPARDALAARVRACILGTPP